MEIDTGHAGCEGSCVCTEEDGRGEHGNAGCNEMECLLRVCFAFAGF